MLLPQHKISMPIRAVHEWPFCHSPFGPSLLATFKSVPDGVVLLATHWGFVLLFCRYTNINANPKKLKPGGSLLSHGETPHYHRRYGVSLLSSAWGQVGPPRYRRQANSFHSGCRFPFGHNTQNQSLNKLNETLCSRRLPTAVL